MSRLRQPNSKRFRGFTLVELLVVIGIIALLIAVLLPALQRAQSQARLVACLANQRSMAQAAYTYTQDFQGWLPRDGMSGVRLGFFIPYLIPLMGGPTCPDIDRVNSDVPYAYDYLKPIKVIKCPAIGMDGDYVLHYVVNSLDFVYFRDKGSYRELTSNGLAWAFQKVHEARSPSTVGYIFEVNMTTLAYNNLGSYNVWNLNDLPFYIAPDSRAPGPILSGNRMISSIDRRHRGKTTVVFFDGHAEIRSLTPGDFPAQILNPYAP